MCLNYIVLMACSFRDSALYCGHASRKSNMKTKIKVASAGTVNQHLMEIADTMLMKYFRGG